MIESEIESKWNKVSKDKKFSEIKTSCLVILFILIVIGSIVLLVKFLENIEIRSVGYENLYKISYVIERSAKEGDKAYVELQELIEKSSEDNKIVGYEYRVIMKMFEKLKSKHYLSREKFLEKINKQN